MTRADSSKYGKKTTEILFSETMEPKEKKKKVGGITCCWMDRGKIAAASPTAEWLLASPRSPIEARPSRAAGALSVRIEPGGSKRLPLLLPGEEREVPNSASFFKITIQVTSNYKAQSDGILSKFSKRKPTSSSSKYNIISPR
jgi:hypothetical protein